MTHHSSNNDTTTVNEEAASWLILLRNPACTRRERKQFEAWLKADASHAREYQNLLEIWTVSDLYPTFPVRTLRCPFTHRVSSLRLFVLAAFLLILLLGGLIAWSCGWQLLSFSCHFADIQLQEIPLSDGPEPQLSVHTSVPFLGFLYRRAIRFGRSEAFPSVSW